MEEKGKVLVTGAAGFIGSHLCERLLELGYSVIGIDNFSNGFLINLEKCLQNEKFRLIKKNIEEVTLDELGSLEGIFHLASGKIPRALDDEGYRTIREGMTTLAWVSNVWLQTKAKLVFSSTSEVYGPMCVVPFKEDDPISIGSPMDKRWVYSASKIHSEQLIMALSRQESLSFAIARLFSVYGPRQHPSWKGGVQSAFLENVRLRKPIEIHGDGSQKRIFTFIDDAVLALVEMFRNSKVKNQIFNVQGSEEDEISMIGLAELVLAINGFEIKDYPIQYLMDYYPKGKDSIESKIADLTKIRRELGWMAKVPLKKGLMECILSQMH